MPKLSEFEGMLIFMRIRGEHNPPHIHVLYSGDTSIIDFNGDLLGGNLPSNKLKILKEWISLHKTELEVNWSLIKSKQLPNLIRPWSKL